MNLLGNAIDSIQIGGCIEFKAHEAASHLTIEIEDNGPGIAPEVLPHLFDRYFTTRQKQKKIGSGLGLSICKMILDLHGAAVNVRSKLEQGTCFSLRFSIEETG